MNRQSVYHLVLTDIWILAIVECIGYLSIYIYIKYKMDIFIMQNLIIMYVIYN